MARDADLTARHGIPLFLRREGMAQKTRYSSLPDTVYFFSFMTAAACLRVRPEGMHRAAMAVHTGQFLPKDMPGVPRRSINADKPLRRVIPVTLRTRLPWRHRPMGLGLFFDRREHKLDEKPVLIKQAKLVAFLTHDDIMAAQLPRGIGFPHGVTTAAELRALLDIVIVPDGNYNAESGNNKQ